MLIHVNPTPLLSCSTPPWLMVSVMLFHPNNKTWVLWCSMGCLISIDVNIWLVIPATIKYAKSRDRWVTPAQSHSRSSSMVPVEPKAHGLFFHICHIFAWVMFKTPPSLFFRPKFSPIFHIPTCFRTIFCPVLPQVEALFGLSLSQLHQPLHTATDTAAHALDVATQAGVAEGGAAVWGQLVLRNVDWLEITWNKPVIYIYPYVTSIF